MQEPSAERRLKSWPRRHSSETGSGWGGGEPTEKGKREEDELIKMAYKTPKEEMLSVSNNGNLRECWRRQHLPE